MAKTVQQWCQDRNVAFDELVVQTGLEPDRVRSIVDGRWTPKPEERGKIAAALNVSVEDVAWGHVTPIQHLYGHGPG